jgi:hypothetical protein
MYLRSIALGAALAVVSSAASQARHVETRTVSMPFEICNLQIENTAQKYGATPHDLVNTPSKRVTRVKTNDGYAQVTCLRDRGEAVLVAVTR